VKVWFLTLAIVTTAWGGPQPLTVDKLREFQKEPCTLVHPWANWCTICVQELPDLLPQFQAWKGVRAVVIDVSTPFAQAQFSKKWRVLVDSPFQTYLQPKGDKMSYRKAIDPSWDGALPHSVLYSRGKKLRVWGGAMDFPAVRKEAASLCR
jgi:hypothetical protein